MKKRLDWVDISKGIAILSVVLLHTDYIFPSTAFMPINAAVGGGWHVAVFFLIGGFFLKESQLCTPKAFIWGKAKSLYLLATYIYIPAVLLHNLFFSIGWYDSSILYGGKHVFTYSGIELAKSLVAALCCAGREPIVGALWFVYVLFFAMCGLSLLSWFTKRISEKNSPFLLPILTLLLCIIAYILTKNIGFNIPRFNNTFTAMWLIYVGYWIRNKSNLDFNNIWLFIGFFILFTHYCMSQPKGMSLNSNNYSDVISLTVGSVSALYLICSLSIKIESTKIGSILRECGKESFYIMALQFVGFKLGCLLLNIIGCQLPVEKLLAPTEDKIYLVLYFLFWGSALPILFIKIFRKVKMKIFL